MAIEKIFNPDDPQLSEKLIPGCLPGIVVGLDDPERLGRIQVVCPLIDENSPLPNKNDGWVHMLNPSGGAGSPGGTQNLIHLGDQVLLATIMGDIRSCICLGVLHSKVDPPSPHFDRSQGVYGSHTPQGKIEVNDEAQRRSLKTHNGATEIIDSEGNRTIESTGGAKIFIGAEGETRVENQYGTFGIDGGGNLLASNARSTFSLNPEGEIDIAIDDLSSVRFTPYQTYITGQKDEVAFELDKLKKNAYPALSQFSIWASQLEALSLLSKDDYPVILESLYQIDEILEQVVSHFQNLELARDAIAFLSAQAPLDLGAKIAGQIDTFRDLDLVKIVEKYAGGLTEEEIANLPSELEKLLDKKLLKGLDFSVLQSALASLQQDPDLQLKAVLEAIVPVEPIDAVLGSGLYQQTNLLKGLTRRLDELKLDAPLAKIDNLGSEGIETIEALENIFKAVEKIAPPINLGAARAMVSQLKSSAGQLQSFIARLQEDINSAKDHLAEITTLKQDLSLEIELGNNVFSSIENLSGCLSAIAPLVEEGMVVLADFISALIQVTDFDQIEELTTLATLLPKVTEFSGSDPYPYLLLDSGQAILLGDFARAEDLVVDLATRIVPSALKSLSQKMAADMEMGLAALKKLDRSLSSQTTGGGMVLDSEGALSKSDSGKLGGNVIQDRQCAALYGPAAHHGLGAKVVAQTDKAILAAAGSDVGLGGVVEANDFGVDIKTPGAELGLGFWFQFNQEEAFFYAPGGKKDLGSSAMIDTNSIKLFAPGGKKAAGSKIEINNESVGIYAPGGNDGSSLVVNLESAQLYSPGGRSQGGTKIKLTPEQLSLLTSGAINSEIVLRNNGLSLALPRYQAEVKLSPSGITLKSMLAKIKLNKTYISLSVGGSSIRVLPNAVLVNGVPIRVGRDLF